MTMASVFSGIGGEMVAAAMMGWDIKFFCEKNEFGNKVLSYWFPNATSYEDITTTDFSQWRGRINVLTGGFPCQPFSYAGQRRGAEDDRYLWPHMHRCINEVQPDWVVCENVAGILTMVEQGEVAQMESQAYLFDTGDMVRRYRLVETFTLERISRDLESDGYEVQSVLVPACAVGAPTEETGCLSSDTVLLQTPTTVQTDEPPESMRARAEKNGYKNGTKFGSLTSQLEYDERVRPLLKTPCAADSYTDKMTSKGVSGTSGTLAQEVVSGYAEKHRGLLLPTPCCVEAYHPERVKQAKEMGLKNFRSRTDKEKDLHPAGILDCLDFHDMLPTPTARDWKGPQACEYKDMSGEGNEMGFESVPGIVAKAFPSDDGTPSRLSPLFVADMMGFPVMWCDI